VDRRAGAVASISLAPLVDGPRQHLTVVHRSRSVWQLADPTGRVVACITFDGALRLPHAISLAQAPRTTSLVVGDGTVGWDDQSLPVVRWWRPARPDQPSLRSRVRDDIAVGFARTWRHTLGRGEGLTPYADDVVCGILATLQAARHPLAATVSGEIAASRLEDRTTAASAGLLRQAAAGWCLDEVAAVLAAHATGRGQTAAGAVLRRVGHSSGRGLLEGIDRVLRTTVRGATA
jgi:hypothetical protein